MPSRLRAICLAAGVIFALSLALPCLSRPGRADDRLDGQFNAAACRIRGSLRSGNYARATSEIQQLLEGAGSAGDCLMLVQATESVGFHMIDARRMCFKKALSLAASRDDFFKIAAAARSNQMFDITKEATTLLIQRTTTVPELYDLASEAQRAADNEVAHRAMEKAYTGVKTIPDAYAFAEQCKAMRMEDLLRKVIKEMIDDEDNVSELCNMALKFAPYNYRDLTRWALRQAITRAKTIAEMEDVLAAAKQLNEPDFVRRATFYVNKGRAMERVNAPVAPAPGSEAPAAGGTESKGPGSGF